MKPIFALLIMFVTATACNTNTTFSKQPTHDDNIYHTGGDDTAMNSAIANAQRHFSDFDSAFTSRLFNTGSFSIKVRLPAPDGSAEHI